MFTLIDRQMIRGYFKAYIVCLVSLLSLYVVVDMFMNLDDFARADSKGQSDFLGKVAMYYGFRVFQIFDRLCEAILLLSAMFTVAWMQRNNEQVPLLSAGVSTHRIVRPVLIATVMLSLTVLNQELMIPRIASQLTYDRSDPAGDKNVFVRGVWDSKDIHVEGDWASRKSQTIYNFRCLISETLARELIHLEAKQAYYVQTGPRQGYWELINTHPPDLGESFNPKILEIVDSGRYRLHTNDLDFDALTRDPNWYMMASTSRLYTELQKPESNRLSAMAVLFHVRMVRPVLGMLLVFMGLSVILRDQNRNIIISSGMCLVLCGMFFVSCYACKMLGENDIVSPSLAAWLPVLFFGPFAVVLFDAVHT